MKGIEVAPWIAPVVSKAAGYNVKVIDVFDSETLRTRAIADPNLPSDQLHLLEAVDFVGSATEIAALVPKEEWGSYDYILSSHNFEHLPNPVKFLQGCGKVLRDGGLLSMAVPDRRGCFDYYRSNTTLGEWLEAFAEDRARPKRQQLFDSLSSYVEFVTNRGLMGSAKVGVDPMTIRPHGSVLASYQRFYEALPEVDYVDAHCTVMTPASLELLLLDLRQLGLVRFEVEEIHSDLTFEFFVRLRFRADCGPLPEADYNARRQILRDKMMADYFEQQPQVARVARDRALPAPKRFAHAVKARLCQFRGLPQK